MSTDEIQSSNTDSAAVGGMVYQAAWTPDSLTLLASTRPLYEGPGLALNYDLWQIDAQTGQKSQTLGSGEGGMFFLSPDGQQLALSRPTRMDLINLDGSNRRSAVLNFAAVITYSEYMYHPAPVWAPDSSYLRVIIPAEDPLAVPLEPASLYRIPLDGSQAVPEGTIPLAALTQAQYSPDLQHIAYLTSLGQNNRELRIAAANGATERVTASGEVGFLSWAPDSNGFAYYSGMPTDALLGDLSGTANDLADVKPVFSVRWIDSTRLFFMSRTDTAWQVRLGMAGGSSNVLAELPYDINGFNPQLESSQ
jgi:Tol biopolymer transport system component